MWFAPYQAHFLVDSGTRWLHYVNSSIKLDEWEQHPNLASIPNSRAPCPYLQSDGLSNMERSPMQVMDGRPMRLFQRWQGG